MRPQQYRVELTEDERARLEKLISSGTAPAQDLTHARILLKADKGAAGPGWSDRAISEALDIDPTTVGRVRRRYAEKGLEAALKRAPTTRQYVRKLDGAAEAHLIALTCGSTPSGQKRWTLRLLADRLVQLGQVDSVSHETVRQVLEETNSSRG